MRYKGCLLPYSKTDFWRRHMHTCRRLRRLKRLHGEGEASEGGADGCRSPTAADARAAHGGSNSGGGPVDAPTSAFSEGGGWNAGVSRRGGGGADEAAASPSLGTPAGGGAGASGGAFNLGVEDMPLDVLGDAAPRGGSAAGYGGDGTGEGPCPWAPLLERVRNRRAALDQGLMSHFASLRRQAWSCTRS